MSNTEMLDDDIWKSAVSGVGLSIGAEFADERFDLIFITFSSKKSAKRSGKAKPEASDGRTVGDRLRREFRT